MKLLLEEEVLLRRMIRSCLSETRAKVNSGWEGYQQGRGVDNSDILVGYPAAYHSQYADSTLGQYHLGELDTGGENVIKRRKKQRKKKA